MSGGFGSYNVSLPTAAGALGGLLFWVALAAVIAGAARSGRRLRAATSAERLRALCAWVLASVAAILCTSKVLSPQFLIWLLPWPALLAPPAAGSPLIGRATLYWTVAALALTQTFYPFLYGALRAGQPLVVALLMARNASLIALAAATARLALASDCYKRGPPVARRPAAVILRDFVRASRRWPAGRGQGDDRLADPAPPGGCG